MMARRRLFRRAVALAASVLAARAGARMSRTVDVHRHGAVGDGKTLDTAALQHAIDDAATDGAQVRLRGGRTYLSGSLTLRGDIDFHVEHGARLLASADPADYPAGGAAALHSAGIAGPAALLHAIGANDLTLSGPGTIDGRSPEFMAHYDAENEWWVPKGFRPRLIVLENCERLGIRDLRIERAPSWTIHLLGCRRVLIERIVIRNQLDVPNCDGIDPDHCQDVEIRDCDIVCGDDAIVIKTTAGHDNYGPSRGIHVHDCVLRTQDSGLKIGTETTQDIHGILFERCRILSSCRGLCIQLRDGGDVHDVTFRDIEFVARRHSAPWWGHGEAISFTAIPRMPATKLGTIRDVTVANVRGRAENSVRIEGLGGGRIGGVTLDQVQVTLDRWTRYLDGAYDNRPTTAAVPPDPHPTPGISLRHADRVTLRGCVVQWGPNPTEAFGPALVAEDVTALDNLGFTGDAAHPERDPPTLIR